MQLLLEHYESGRLLLKNESWAEAAREFEQILSIEPNYRDVVHLLKRVEYPLRLEKLYTLADEKFQLQEWHEAIYILQEILENEPNYRDVSSRLEYAQQQVIDDLLPAVPDFRLEVGFFQQQAKIGDELLKLTPTDRPTAMSATVLEFEEPPDMVNIRLSSDDFAIIGEGQDVVTLTPSPRLSRSEIEREVKLRPLQAGSCRLDLRVMYNDRQARLKLPPIEIKPSTESKLPQLPNPLASRSVRQPDIILRVVTTPMDREEDAYRLSYSIHSLDPHLDQLYLKGLPAGEITLTKEDLRRIRQALETTLRQSAFLSSEAMAARLAAIGHDLYDLLLPKELQTYYQDIAQMPTVSSWLILTDPSPWLPWELIKPPFQDEFWGARYHLSRWIEGSGQLRHCEIPIGPIYLTMQAHLSFRGRQWEQLFPPGTLFAFDDYLLSEKNVDYRTALAPDSPLWGIHFVGYPQALIEKKGELIPVNHADKLSEKVVDNYWPDLRRKRPLVGFSLLRPDQESALTKIEETWLPTFIRAGAGAFVGPYWATSPQADQLFWFEFYQGVWGRLALGAALHRARQQVRAIIPDSMDWLAYVLVGDPMAQGYRPEWGEGYTALECVGYDLKEALHVGQTYHFRATLQSVPPLWYNGEIYQVESRPYHDPQLAVVAPEFETEPLLPQRLAAAAKDSYTLEFDLIPKVAGQHRVSAIFLEAERPLQSVDLYLNVKYGQS